jgi:hypothetical protein
MRQRCSDTNDKHYKDYGGRGIQVCERWDDFSVFLNDILTGIGPRPRGQLLDRIDNDAGYFSENVKWSTPLQSANNQRPRRDGRSGIIGVYQRGCRWQSIIRRHSNNSYLGTFDTPEEATAARAAFLEVIIMDEAVERLYDAAVWNRLETEIVAVQSRMQEVWLEV